MNWDQIEGSWKQLKGKVKGKWGKSGQNELGISREKRDHLPAKMEAKYGNAKQEANKKFHEFLNL